MAVQQDLFASELESPRDVVGRVRPQQRLNLPHVARPVAAERDGAPIRGEKRRIRVADRGAGLVDALAQTGTGMLFAAIAPEQTRQPRPGRRVVACERKIGD